MTLLWISRQLLRAGPRDPADASADEGWRRRNLGEEVLPRGKC